VSYPIPPSTTSLSPSLVEGVVAGVAVDEVAAGSAGDDVVRGPALGEVA
jgi:hypothetical protein